jgi:glucuronate isomerase
VLRESFGVSERPSREAADAIYDRIPECLAAEEYRPREVFKSLGVDVLATTDDPCANLSHHAGLGSDPGLKTATDLVTTIPRQVFKL